MFCAAMVEGVDEAISIRAITEGRGERKSVEEGSLPQERGYGSGKPVLKIKPKTHRRLKSEAEESLKRMSASHAWAAGMRKDLGEPVPCREHSFPKIMQSNTKILQK